MFDTIRVRKAEVYHNTRRLTIEQIKKERGCTHALNAWLFDNDPRSETYFQPCNWLIINHEIVVCDPYNDYGFACDETGSPVMTTDRTKKYFISGVPLLKDGVKLERWVDPAVARSSEKTAICWMADGRVVPVVDKLKRTIEELKDYLLSLGCVDALLMDGGGSTQGDFPNGVVYSSRIVATVILLWEENEVLDEEEIQEGESDMFKIALGAGHGINTAGKRCLKSIDPNETREWWLNDRICDYVEKNLSEYEGYRLLRLDDSDDGRDNPALEDRVSAANKFDADFYLSVHHNAGINGGSGGGIVVYTCIGCSAASKQWSADMYEALIRHTGLKGNRSNGQDQANYYVLKNSKMPAVLLELGFMDSKTDVPIILTDDYAKKCAAAITEVLVKRGGLTRKVVQAAPANTIYRVQVGAFSNKSNAENLLAKLKAAGFDGFITTKTGD